MRTLFDTSILVTALVDQIGNHEAALRALQRYTSGAVYDALHAHCARKEHVDRILTYNLSDFARFDRNDVLVAAP